jgi:hypothetical protein
MQHLLSVPLLSFLDLEKSPLKRIPIPSPRSLRIKWLSSRSSLDGK